MEDKEIWPLVITMTCQTTPTGNPLADQKYLMDKWIDAAKFVGTANSAAFFGALIALYYYSSWSQTIQRLIALTAALYFFGFMFSILSYKQLTDYLMTFDPVYGPSIPKHRDAEQHFKSTARRLANTSIIFWVFGSMLAFFITGLLAFASPLAPRPLP